MDGSIRINHSDVIPSVSNLPKSSKDGERKPFDPDALASEEDTGSEEEPQTNHESIPVGHKLDDESGSHLDLTA